MTNNKGFSLLEVIIAMTIVTLMAVTVFVSLSAYRSRHAVSDMATNVISALSQARTKTVAGYNDTSYGVNIASTSITLFSGGSFNSSASDNQVIASSDDLTIQPYLVGGATNVYFKRLTGETTQFGYITIKSLSDMTKVATVTISASGVAGQL